MRRTTAYIVLALGGLVLAFALALFCAATVEARWLLLAVLLLVVGVGLAVWGGLSLRRATQQAPENLSDQITTLAEAHGGELTLSQTIAELEMPDEAVLAAFDLLQSRGRCFREREGDREVYTFPDLKPQKVTRRCPYCGAEFAVKEAVYRCPHCGGDLRLAKE